MFEQRISNAFYWIAMGDLAAARRAIIDAERIAEGTEFRAVRRAREALERAEERLLA